MSETVVLFFPTENMPEIISTGQLLVDFTYLVREFGPFTIWIAGSSVGILALLAIYSGIKKVFDGAV